MAVPVAMKNSGVDFFKNQNLNMNCIYIIHLLFLFIYFNGELKPSQNISNFYKIINEI